MLEPLLRCVGPVVKITFHSLRLFEGCWHFRQPGVGSSGTGVGCGAGAPVADGVARVVAREAAGGVRGSAAGVVAGERGGEGSIDRLL